MKKAILYINQFFAGIGGEDKADQEPVILDGTLGPGLALKGPLNAEITHTVYCGDNFMGSNTEEAIDRIIKMLEPLEFDVFLAGPAFQAGRYGVACGNIAKAVAEKFNVPVITSMNVENPGVEMFRKDMIILEGGNSAASMKKDAKAMADVANILLDGKKLKPAKEQGYFSRGKRDMVWMDEPVIAARRGVDMLIKKLSGEAFETELPVPEKDIIPVATPIKDLSTARIAIVTTGGIVPVDNPDRIQSASATRWGRYDMTGMERLNEGEFKTIHAGFDPAAANADPNVIVPLDALRELNEKGVFGTLHPYFYTTVGTGTTQAEAARMGREILKYLEEDKVDGVLLVST